VKWGLWCALIKTSDGDACRAQMSGVGGVPRKLLWTRQDGGSRCRMWTSRRRQCQGRGRRVDIHSRGQQLCTRIKMSWRRKVQSRQTSTCTTKPTVHRATPPRGRCADAKKEISRDGRVGAFEHRESVSLSPVAHHGRKEYPSRRKGHRAPSATPSQATRP
jgi:hypothetical protein